MSDFLFTGVPRADGDFRIHSLVPSFAKHPSAHTGHMCIPCSNIQVFNWKIYIFFLEPQFFFQSISQSFFPVRPIILYPKEHIVLCMPLILCLFCCYLTAFKTLIKDIWLYVFQTEMILVGSGQGQAHRGVIIIMPI